jgi:hypothetical protein
MCVFVASWEIYILQRTTTNGCPRGRSEMAEELNGSPRTYGECRAIPSVRTTTAPKYRGIGPTSLDSRSAGKRARQPGYPPFDPLHRYNAHRYWAFRIFDPLHQGQPVAVQKCEKCLRQ